MTTKIDLERLENLLQSAGEQPPRLFALISWGATATAWLAKLLNAHPECFCTHHLNFAVSLKAGNHDPNNDLSIMETLARLGFHYRLVGDCHGINRESVPQLLEKFGERFRACVLVRHPITRIESSLKHAKNVGLEYYGLDYQILKDTLDTSLKNLLQTEEQLFFVHIMNLINVVEKEVNVGPIFLMENVTRDFHTAQKLMQYLSADELDLNSNLYTSSSQKSINQHSKLANSSPETLFEKWPEWQREAFRVLLNPKAKEIYQQLGYDLSCIEG
ncbi:MAG TPA: hypothetical protein V6D11_32535 [Waterburya sp.]|jgi:hypothetical protein